MPILLAFPVAFAGYKALAACLVLKRNAESYTRADADKMSALPAQPADCPEKLPRPRVAIPARAGNFWHASSSGDDGVPDAGGTPRSRAAEEGPKGLTTRLAFGRR